MSSKALSLLALQEKQVAALKARTKIAEDLAASEQIRAAKLQQELTAAKGGQANNALRLMDIQNNNQQLELKLARAGEALQAEQAARTEASKQVCTASSAGSTWGVQQCHSTLALHMRSL